MAPSLFGILWRTTWTMLISLCIYISTAIYPNAESTNGDIQVKVSSVWQRREMWSCEGHNSGAVAESLYSVCKHTFTWTWSNQCNCGHQTARNNHVGTNISMYQYLHCTSLDILHLYPWIFRGLVVSVYLLYIYSTYIYCISTVYLSCIYWWHRGYPARLPLLTVPQRHIMW